jgi:hypothetical protein
MAEAFQNERINETRVEFEIDNGFCCKLFKTKGQVNGRAWWTTFELLSDMEVLI